jgi:hypothetical protein
MARDRMLEPNTLGDHIDRLFRAAWALSGSRTEAEDLRGRLRFELPRRRDSSVA